MYSHTKSGFSSKNGFAVGKKGEEQTVIDTNGSLYQNFTQITASAAELNAATTSAGAWATLLEAGNGYGKDYLKTASGDDTLVADPVGNYDLILIVTVIEEFADGGTDSQTLVKIGKAAAGSDYMDNTALTDAAVGTQIIIEDSMASGDIVNVNVTAAEDSGTGGTGAVNVMAFIKAQS